MTTARATALREVRRQLSLPGSWLAIGLFALLAGIAFVTTLDRFLEQNSEALSGPSAQPIDVNQLLIRPFLIQVGMAALVVLPLITARALPQDRRAGGALRVVLAAFAGVLGLYSVMLLASLALVALLFVHGAPEWGPIASGYLGLLLAGAAFISAALFISSLSTSAAGAGVATFAVALMLGAAAWLARSGTAAAQPVFRYLSVGEGLDDFAKGIVDTGHLAWCLTIVALGLFLSVRALEPRESGH